MLPNKLAQVVCASFVLPTRFRGQRDPTPRACPLSRAQFFTRRTPVYVTPSLEPAGKSIYTGHESLSADSRRDTQLSGAILPSNKTHVRTLMSVRHWQLTSTVHAKALGEPQIGVLGILTKSHVADLRKRASSGLHVKSLQMSTPSFAGSSRHTYQHARAGRIESKGIKCCTFVTVLHPTPKAPCQTLRHHAGSKGPPNDEVQTKPVTHRIFLVEAHKRSTLTANNLIERKRVLHMSDAGKNQSLRQPQALTSTPFPSRRSGSHRCMRGSGSATHQVDDPRRAACRCHAGCDQHQDGEECLPHGDAAWIPSSASFFFSSRRVLAPSLVTVQPLGRRRRRRRRSSLIIACERTT